MGTQAFRECFRTIRLFERERGWYFLSPDGLAVGPYVTERIAESQAVRLAEILKKLPDTQSARIAVIEFALEATTHELPSEASVSSCPERQRMTAHA